MFAIWRVSSHNNSNLKTAKLIILGKFFNEYDIQNGNISSQSRKRMLKPKIVIIKSHQPLSSIYLNLTVMHSDVQFVSSIWSFNKLAYWWYNDFYETAY